jgi:Protein of unknown function (DUF3102)
VAIVEVAEAAAASAVSGPLSVLHTQVSLESLVGEINRANVQAEEAFREGVRYAIRAGELLLQAKSQLSHGRWEKWLKANIRFRPRTARAYMQIAELDAEKRQRVADLPMREALKAIAQRKYLTPEEANPERFAPARAVVIDGTDWTKYEAPSSPAPTPEENADDLVAHLEHCAVQGNISEAHLVEAFSRRFSPVVGEDDAAVSAEKRKQEYSVPEHKAVSAKDNALNEFDGHVLRLLQMTKNAKPERFAKTTGVPADDLARLAGFLAQMPAKLRGNAS